MLKRSISTVKYNMHYIIGAQIVVPDYTRTVVHSGVTQTAPQQKPSAEIKKFKPSSRYTLYNIEKTDDDKFQYTFHGSEGDAVKLKFSNPGEADTFISNARGEDIPNYSKFYQGRAD